MSIIVLLQMAVILLFAIIYSGNNLKDRDLTFLIIAFLLCFFVHGFKNPHLLPDTPLYLKGFIEAGATDWKVLLEHGFKLHCLKAEAGYVILNKALYGLLSWNQAIFLLTSFVILIGYFVAIRKYSPIPWLSVIILLLTVFNMSLFVLRQFMAMSIVLFSIRYVLQRQLVKFLLIIFIAFTIHQTALIFIPIYYLYGISNMKKIMLVIGGIGILIFALKNFLFVLSIKYSSGYEHYLNHDSQGANATGAIIMASILAYRLYVLRNTFFEGTLNKFLSIVQTVAFVFSVVGIGFTPTNRLIMYYSAMGFLIMPDTLAKDTNNITKYIIGGVYLLIYYYKFFQDDILERFQLIFT